VNRYDESAAGRTETGSKNYHEEKEGIHTNGWSDIEGLSYIYGAGISGINS
jgi:hypothetical protein